MKKTYKMCLRELRHQVLNKNAKLLLKQFSDIDYVAELLGFSDARSFNKAFKSWNDVTPAAYRASTEKSNRKI